MALGLRTVWRMLEPPERRRASALLVAIAVVAVLEAAAVASVLPFLSALLSVKPPLGGGILDVLSPLYDVIGRRPRVILAVAFLLALIAANTASFLVARASLRFVYGVGQRVSTRLLATYLSLPYARFVQLDLARANKNVLDEGAQMVQGFLRPVAQLAAASAVVLSIGALMLMLTPAVALVVMLFLGAGYGLFYLQVRRRAATSGSERVETNRRRFRAVADAFGGLKESKVAGKENFFVEKFERASREDARLQALNQLRLGVPRYVVETLAIAGLVLLGIYFDSKGGDVRGALPTIGVVVFAAWRMMPPFQQVIANLAQIRFHRPALEALADDLKEEPPADSAAPPTPLRLRHEIRLDKVTVRHAQAAGPVIVDADLQIPCKGTVALVGRTGAGKSTLADVVLGLLTPEKGQLLVDGVPITAANRRAWQENVGYVPQRIYLMNDTLRNNIAFGVRPDEIDDVRIREVARIAHVEEFAKDLPAGYDTIIGERGVRLSGGQQQRIGIARALYHDPAVLVLDEATSELDPVTEAALNSSIEEMRGERTILLIAHRMSTVERCDRIYVLDAGRVVASGTYEELLRDTPAFRALAAVAPGN